MANPAERVSQPSPPPSVKPPTPVSLTIPTVTARPCSWVAASRSRSRASSAAPITAPATASRRVCRTAVASSVVVVIGSPSVGPAAGGGG